MIDKVARMALLYDIYGSLLTARQQTLVELYYFDDWSLSEVAEAEKVSRQAVHDNLKRAEELLESYESKLRVLTKQVSAKTSLDMVWNAWSKAREWVPETVSDAMEAALTALQQQVE